MKDPNTTLKHIRELAAIGSDLTPWGVNMLCEMIGELDEACIAGNYPRDWIPF